MKLNTTTLILITVGLGIVVAAQTYFLFDFHSKNKALEKSYDLLDGKLESQKELNKKQFDSIQQIIHWQDEYISDLNSGLDQIEKSLDKINSDSNDKKSHIHGITDADVLTDILTRRYR